MTVLAGKKLVQLHDTCIELVAASHFVRRYAVVSMCGSSTSRLGSRPISLSSRPGMTWLALQALQQRTFRGQSTCWETHSVHAAHTERACASCIQHLDAKPCWRSYLVQALPATAHAAAVAEQAQPFACADVSGAVPVLPELPPAPLAMAHPCVPRLLPDGACLRNSRLLLDTAAYAPSRCLVFPLMMPCSAAPLPYLGQLSPQSRAGAGDVKEGAGCP